VHYRQARLIGDIRLNTNPDEEDRMAGKIEIRASGDKFRFVVMSRNGEKLLQSGQFDDKPSAKRAASSLAKAVTGAEISDATKPAPAATRKAAPRPGAKH
jgi:uncharacterized protein YegP (UPF0339 family)